MLGSPCSSVRRHMAGCCADRLCIIEKSRNKIFKTIFIPERIFIGRLFRLKYVAISEFGNTSALFVLSAPCFGHFQNFQKKHFLLLPSCAQKGFAENPETS